MKKLSDIIIITFAAGMLSLLLTGCGKKTEAPAGGVITFLTGDVKINSKTASQGIKVVKNDKINTGENSIAVLQFSQTAVITVRSNTEIVIEDLHTPGKKDSSYQINQKKGSTFNKIVKKGTPYSIKTPTAVAGIRGTTFDVVVSKNRGRIRLLEGKVNISPVKEGKVIKDKSIVLTEGKAVTITEEKVEKPVEITKSEKEVLEKFDKIAIVREIDKIEKVPENKVKEKEVKEKIGKDAVNEILKKEIIEIEKADDKTGAEKIKKPKKLTLDDLVKKFGNLSVVETKDGKRYTGSFKQKGDKIEVITTAGRVVVDSGNIKKISRYKK